MISPCTTRNIPRAQAAAGSWSQPCLGSMAQMPALAKSGEDPGREAPRAWPQMSACPNASQHTTLCGPHGISSAVPLLTAHTQSTLASSAQNSPSLGVINLKQDAGPSPRTSFFHARSWSRNCPLNGPLCPCQTCSAPQVFPHGASVVACCSVLPSQASSSPGTNVGTRKAAPRTILPSRSPAVLRTWWDPPSASTTRCEQPTGGTGQL